MSLVLTPGTLANAGAAALLVGLGVYVATRRPRRWTNVAFGAFAAGFGGAWGPGFLFTVDDPRYFVFNVGWLFLGGMAIAGLLGLALLFPRRVGWSERRLLRLPVALMATIVPVHLWAQLRDPDRWTRFRLEELGWQDPTLALIDVVIYSSLMGAFLFCQALFAMRFRAAHLADQHEEARAYTLLTAALLLATAPQTGYPLSPRDPFGGETGAALLAGLIVVAGLWLWAGHGTTKAAARTSRNMAILGMATAFGAQLLTLLMGRAFYVPVGGSFRLLCVLLLAWAILRGQLLGIDVRVRWTISKTTVAAVVIAVFFVVSEGAQEFFGERFESAYLGILAAGALVFVIAPLSRMADRIAEKAVPSATPPAPRPGATAEQEEMYRSAIRLALRDRRLTRQEERELFRLARGLGLPAERAHEILAEIEETQVESAWSTPNKAFQPTRLRRAADLDR